MPTQQGVARSEQEAIEAAQRTIAQMRLPVIDVDATSVVEIPQPMSALATRPIDVGGSLTEAQFYAAMDAFQGKSPIRPLR